MKKNKYDKFLQWCLDECWRIQKHLHLTEYRIQLEIAPENKTTDDFAFEITINAPYKDALLKWKEQTFIDWQKDKKKVTRYLLHEMLHIIVNPLALAAGDRYTSAKHIADLDEALTDYLTNILIWGINKK